MKKFILYCLVAIMLVSSVSIIASAAASDWKAGNGFYVWQSATHDTTPWLQTNKVQGEKVPVVISDAEGNMGVTVEHAGYYTSGDNWGGVSSKEKVDMDGLEVTVYYETVPAVTTASDCWLAIDLLGNCDSFHVTDGKNPGFVELIRFATAKLESFRATGWGGKGSDEGFTVKSGDTIVLKSNYDAAEDQFVFVFNHNGKDYPVSPAFTAEVGKSVLTDGKGHVTVIANCYGSDADNGFKYTINVKNGTPLSEEILRAKETRAAHAAAIESIKAQYASIEQVYSSNADNKNVVESKSQDVIDNLAAMTAKFEEATAKFDELTAILGNSELDTEGQAAALNTLLEEIKAINIECQGIDERILSSLEAEQEDAEAGDEAAAEDEAAADAPAATAPTLGGEKKSEFPVIPVVIVVVVVVVIAAVVVVVLLKKKK